MPQTDTRLAGLSSPFDGLLAGAATGVGSLPHRDARAAAEFSLARERAGDDPEPPRRSPAESLIAQAVVGTPGITLGQYGAIAVDLDRLDPEAPVVTDLSSDGFGGFRAFLDHAAASGFAGSTVKWSFAGPVTLGVALLRAGAPAEIAFDVAARSVRSHVTALGKAVADALPGSPQLVVLDEPAMADLMSPDFALPPDAAVDLLSTAMAAGGAVRCGRGALLRTGRLGVTARRRPRRVVDAGDTRTGIDRWLPAAVPGRTVAGSHGVRSRSMARSVSRGPGLAPAQQAVVRVRALRRSIPCSFVARA